MRRATAAVVAVVAVGLGVVAGMVGLVTGAAVTGSRIGAVLIGVVVLAAVAAGLALLAVRLAGAGRVWLPVGAAVAALVVFAVPVGAALFGPVPPAGQGPDPGGVRFWDLPTGSRLAYVHTPARGQARATPVVLVHGGPGAPSFGAPHLARGLADAGFDVYAYHQLGAGRSSRAADIGDYTVARHVADLEAIRAALGAQTLIPVGTSWGAQLVAHYLAAHPQRVARAVVVSPGTIWAPAYAGDTHLIPEGRSDQRAALSRHPRFLLAQALLAAAGPRAASALFPDHRIDGEYEAFVADLNLAAGCPGPGRAATESLGPQGFGFWVNAMTARDARTVADPRPALRGLPTPLLVLRGECDYLAPAVAREYTGLLPNSTLVEVAAAGHDLDRDQPTAYQTRITGFLTEKEPPAA